MQVAATVVNLGMRKIVVVFIRGRIRPGRAGESTTLQRHDWVSGQGLAVDWFTGNSIQLVVCLAYSWSVAAARRRDSATGKGDVLR